MSRTTPKPKSKPKEPRPPERGGHRNLIREAEEILEEEREDAEADPDPE